MQDRTFSVVLPWPLSANKLHRHGAGRRPYISPRHRAWYEIVQEMVQEAPGFRPCGELFTAEDRLRVDYALVPPSRRALDLDNRDKLVYDVLQRSGLIANDGQIYAGERVKFDKQGRGKHAGIYVWVSVLPPDFGTRFDLEIVREVLPGARCTW